ncbi:MAG: arylesterase [Gammaproteobacteria bacterium]|nr:arylesterase [Rhodocyclaceae bacterium]MBU3908637.1 arylesterase [Gammaproteobacteria bacterium]MBU3988693.1 arylesterase [Gammaproteobacteria bacterium]MBU4004665.1 arylesterase [Gammaproteobacteria bacterium]MBU4021268.1 arylesterase [Gammaproteobacteria bacterium]
MNLSLRTFLIASTLVALLLVGACGREPKHSSLPAGSVVLALGDSVTFGTGAAPGEDYPTQLASLTGWAILNQGIPGDTSAGLKARVESALDETKPALVIVEIGGNDFLRRQPESETKENVRAILKRIKQTGIPVVLVATPKFSPLGAAFGLLPDSPIFAELAEEEKVPLVPAIFAKVLADANLKSDQIHPNATGYRKLAEGIAADLVNYGFVAKK